MGYRLPHRIVEISELILQLPDSWNVRLKKSGKEAWISTNPKVLLDILPGKALVIADWYYQKRLRYLNEATPVENAF